MNTPPQQDAPTMFYPVNPCGHLRGPGGACIGFPECKREPVSADKMGPLVQRAGELRARLLAHPSQAFTGEGRAAVADKLGAAVTLAECLNVVLISLLEDRAAMTTEEHATAATIGANVEMRVRDLRVLFTASTAGANPETRGSTR
jgi:hypothetical protein